MSLKRIEIYLSEGSPEDMELYNLWKTLSAQGRGRAQNAFRSALMSLVVSPTDIMDVRNHRIIPQKQPQKRGPKKTWKPEKTREPENLQRDDVLLKDAQLKEPKPSTIETDTTSSETTLSQENILDTGTFSDSEENNAPVDTPKDNQTIPDTDTADSDIEPVLPEAEKDIPVESQPDATEDYKEDYQEPDDNLEGLKLEEDKSVVPIFIPKNKKETETKGSESGGGTGKSRFASLF